MLLKQHKNRFKKTWMPENTNIEKCNTEVVSVAKAGKNAVKYKL